MRGELLLSPHKEGRSEVMVRNKAGKVMRAGKTGTMLLIILAATIVSVAVASFVAYTPAAHALGTTITVNSKGDGAKEGNCTLREAIEAANTNQAVDECPAGSATEKDVIVFVLSSTDTVRLVFASELEVTDAAGLVVNGGRAKIRIHGNSTAGVFSVKDGAKLALKRLRVVWGSGFGAGGGVFNLGGTVTVTDTTFSESVAGSGSGIYNAGTATVTNSTFSGNFADWGGGIYNKGALTVTNSTFSENEADDDEPFGGGAIYNEGGTATFRNTIVAKSTAGDNCRGVAITDGGYNIDDGTTCGFSKAENSMPFTNPKLASDLADNGGPTKTIALLRGSPALNAIPDEANGCGTDITTDQRGVVRPQGAGCDIGAFEKEPRRR
jgi:CSLREA domain-containing protein